MSTVRSKGSVKTVIHPHVECLGRGQFGLLQFLNVTSLGHGGMETHPGVREAETHHKVVATQQTGGEGQGELKGKIFTFTAGPASPVCSPHYGWGALFLPSIRSHRFARTSLRHLALGAPYQSGGARHCGQSS